MLENKKREGEDLSLNQPNETGRTIEQTFQRETYDKEAKHLLALTEVAARILQGVVAEFQNKSLAEIEACILNDLSLIHI